MSGHDYLSTGCLHGDLVLPDGRSGHEYCQGDTGAAGAKRPAQCKFCGAACRCVCHQAPRVVVDFPDGWTRDQVTHWRAVFGEQVRKSRPDHGFLRVGQLMPGCWEAWCLECFPITGGFLGQVATWERAMLRAGEHVREVHGG